MAPVLLLIGIGGLMVYSSLKGLSLTDVLSGAPGDTLDPHGAPITNTATQQALGASGDVITDASGNATTGVVSGVGHVDTPGTISSGNWTPPAGGAHGFKGTHASQLNTLAGIAQGQFDLTITATTNGAHVPGSLHYSDEAFDASGSETNMRAFAQYVADNYPQVTELIHNPGFAIKNGHPVNGPLFYAAVWAGHANHVHVGWR